MPLFGLRARRFAPPEVTISWFQPAPSDVVLRDQARAHGVQAVRGDPGDVLHVARGVGQADRDRDGDEVDVADVRVQLRGVVGELAEVPHQVDVRVGRVAHRRLDQPGPGLSRKVIGLPIENHTRPPAICGMVMLVVEPGPPSGIAQLTASGAPVAARRGGVVQGVAVRFEQDQRVVADRRPVTKAYTVSELVLFQRDGQRGRGGGRGARGDRADPEAGEQRGAADEGRGGEEVSAGNRHVGFSPSRHRTRPWIRDLARRAAMTGGGAWRREVAAAVGPRGGPRGSGLGSRFPVVGNAAAGWPETFTGRQVR
jgi:hypothetical protein